MYKNHEVITKQDKTFHPYYLSPVIHPVPHYPSHPHNAH